MFTISTADDNAIVLFCIFYWQALPVFDTYCGFKGMELVPRYLVYIPTIFGITEKSDPHFIAFITLANPITLQKATPKATLLPGCIPSLATVHVLVYAN